MITVDGSYSSPVAIGTSIWGAVGVLFFLGREDGTVFVFVIIIIVIIIIIIIIFL